MKRYWFCVVEIEPQDGGEISDSADARMRRAVSYAARGIGETGEFFSSFDLNEKGAKTIQLEAIMPINNRETKMSDHKKIFSEAAPPRNGN